MSAWDEPPTTLTSFGPLSSDVADGGNLFWRLWRRNKSSSRSSSREGSSDRNLDKNETVKGKLSTDTKGASSSSSNVKEDKTANNVVKSKASLEDQSVKPGLPQSNTAKTEGHVVKPSLPDISTSTARTLSGVLNRLSSIVRTGTLQTYKDSDFKQYWMPDESCKECYDCGDKFTTFRRRHHCRICGQIFCSKCCNQELQGRIIGYKGGIRVCTYCGKVAMSALQNEPSGNISVDKEDLQLSMEAEPHAYSHWGSKKRTSQDLPRSSSMIAPGTPSIDVLIPFDLTQGNPADDINTGLNKKILEDSVQLREIWRQIVDPSKGVEMQSHRIRLKTYYKCIVGNKLVDWLLGNDKAAQRMQAVVIGQALLDAGYLEIIGGQQTIFQDNFALYKPSETTPIDPPENPNPTENSTEPQWLKDIDVKTDHLDRSYEATLDKPETEGSTFYLPLSSADEKDFEPLPRQDSHVSGYTEDIIADNLFGGKQSIPATKLIKSICWRNSDTLKEENGERKAYSLLKKAYQDHLNGLVQQMLSDEGLSKSWMEIVLGTAQRVSNYVRPDVREEGDDMNILKYIKFKKIPGDTKEHTWLVHGVVFTRNIAHKQMSPQITNPYILLLKGSIEYQRVENKFSSLEPQILQEEEFLKKNVKKISSLQPKPNIVIVEKSVSRLAQNYLLEKGITLVYNVKLSVMERIERLTQGSIVPSIDGIVSGPITLGFCHNFKVCHFAVPSGETKTLLSFDGCAQHLGCTIVLRGGSKTELLKIKKVMKQMITACYNSQLEISYCMDEFGIPESGADDTLGESDSVVEFAKSPVKVSDYLKDEKSGLSLIKNDSKVVNNKKVSNNSCGSDSPHQVTEETAVEKPTFHIITSDTNEKDGADSDQHEIQTLPIANTINESTTNLSHAEKTEKPKLCANSYKADHSDSVGSFISSTQNTEKQTHETSSSDGALAVPPKREGIKRQSSGLIPLDDQSDPLYMYQKNKDDAIFYSSVTLEEKTQNRFAKFRKILGERLLSCTPYIKYRVPYLETEEGSRSIVRTFFKDELYWSKYFEPETYHEKKKLVSETNSQHKQSQWASVEIKEPHPLMLKQLTGSLNDKEMQLLIADYRARGGQIQLKPRVTAPDSEKPEHHQQQPDRILPGTDCLEYKNHQSFTVLLSSHSDSSTNYPNPCVPPQLVMMPFYQGNDITLGGFLEKFCFRESYCCQPYRCPSENCEIPLLDHVRRIVHDHGSIFISLRKLSNCVPGGDKDIMMWNWCRKCRQATPLVAMSNDTWSLSFAKFLELRFSVNTFTRRIGPEPCNHSLHHSFSQYFGHRNIVATFKYMPIVTKEIVLPPSVIRLDNRIQLHQWTILRESMRSVEKRGLEMYSGICEQLVTLNSSHEDLTKMVVDLTNMLENEKQRLREMIHEGRQTAIHYETVGLEDPVEFFSLYDDSLKMMRFLADADINWRSKMQELYSQHKKARTSQSKKEKDSTQSGGESSRKDVSGSNSSVKETGMQIKKDASGSLLPVKESVEPKRKLSGTSNCIGNSSDRVSSEEPKVDDIPIVDIQLEKSLNIQDEHYGPQSSGSQPYTSTPVLLNEGDKNPVGATQKERSQSNAAKPVMQDLLVEIEKQRAMSYAGQTDLESQRTNSIGSVNLLESWSGDVIPRSEIPPAESESIAIDQSYVLAESGIYSVTPGISAGIKQFSDQFSDSVDSHYVLLKIAQDSEKEESKPVSNNDEVRQPSITVFSSEGSGQVTMAASNDVPVEKFDTEKKVKNRKESGKRYDDFTDSQQVERISGIMKKTITNFLSGSGLPPLPFPFDCREHHLLPTCYRVPVVIYDLEPSSIIAYGLSSYDYQQRLLEIQSSLTSSQKISGNKESKPVDEDLTENSKKIPGSMLSFVKNKESSPKLPRVDSVRYNPKLETASGDTDEQDGFSFLTTSLPDSDKYKSNKQFTGPHIELQYADHMAKFYCKVYFAEQFRKLRKLIFPAGEEMFIRSLSRCKMWDAKGGKSGSKFCKTDDQRFILKQMSSAEIDVFEKFGPEYFIFMHKSYGEQKPTALGKIVGVYRIGFRNTHTNAGMRQDLLVMENLFYGRKISQTFDLKGSERNRLAATSGKQDEEQVLLDTNLLNLSIESPLYIYPHSKTLLMNVISRDSQFLSTNLVMDYSLLVGLDENKNELVLGIIDYIRTFTWDKKLETIIKSAGGKLPTVVSPDIYRNRFLSAMTRYFLPVPDLWTGKDFDPVLS